MSATHSAFNLLRRQAVAVGDLLMPPQCVSCKQPVGRAGLHCADCWARLAPPSGTRCVVCSDSLPETWAAEATCFGCLHEPPAFRRARAPYLYEGVARETVLAFKNGAEHLASLMARQMLLAATDLDTRALLVPVPLHRWRLFRRGYNQSALLARALAAATGTPLAVDLLVRRKPTPTTRGLGRRQRADAMRGAFAVAPPQRAALKGRTVLLIDDVMTSGATASACAAVLLRAGARHVDVLTYARVAADRPADYAGLSTMRGRDGQD